MEERKSEVVDFIKHKVMHALFVCETMRELCKNQDTAYENFHDSAIAKLRERIIVINANIRKK
jgi:hypothetical protein